MEPPSTSRNESISRFDDSPPTLLAGQGAVGRLDTELALADIDTVLVVCNRSIGSLEAVLDPVLEGLGDRCVGVFDAVTGDKRLRTAMDAADAVRSQEADGILGLGAGSALDVATVTGALVDHPASEGTIHETFLETGHVELKGGVRPLVMVPTTLAGAEQSQAAGITAKTSDDRIVSGGVSDPRLRPKAAVYDATLVAHTPVPVLRNSAMNGFNKGLESLYSPAATPVTDATASHGLALLQEWLPTLERAEPNSLDAILEGMMLVQYGTSRPGVTALSVIHAFGHGITATADIQQGVAHAVITPHVLEAMFARAPCRRELLATTFDVESAEGVIDAVIALRDQLDLPGKLSAVDGVDRSMLPAIAEATAADHLMGNQPPGVELDREDLVTILEAAW